jgi:hypothetical protein
VWQSGIEIQEYGSRDPSGWPRGALCPQNLALYSPTNDGSSVGIVHSRTQTTEFTFSLNKCEKKDDKNCYYSTTGQQVKLSHYP